MIGRRGARRDRDARIGPNLLDMTPVREVEWEEDESGVVTLVRSRPRVRGPRSVGRWVSFMLAPPRIRLDEVGSFAWLRMSGTIKVGDLAALVREEFGERVDPVNQRLGHLVRLLKRERFVSYLELKDPTRLSGP
ncbi:MAG: PqqD family protein [marine benthic group bacterium]|nr:PqqD family protein [Gemmatimonadota bacterium]